MFRFLLSVFLNAIVTPIYLKWATDTAETQIDKMQKAVHFTPGAESPVPPLVLAGGIGLLAGSWLTAIVLRLRTWQAFLSLILGATAGAGFYLWGTNTQRR